MSGLIEWLESHTLPCLYKEILGIPCPGCGMQTAFIELLKGNIGESIRTYPPLIPIIIMVIFLLSHLIFKFRKGAAILKYSFIAISAIMVINYGCTLFIH